MINPTAVRRVAPEAFDLGLSGPTMTSLLLTDQNGQDIQPANDQEGGFRHIVGE
jgi:hypothetical protein